MEKYISKKFMQSILGLSLAIGLGLGVNFVFADWQGPTGNPTTGNPSNILTTGGDQVKTGKLNVASTDSSPGIGYGFQVGNEAAAYLQGKKGIISYGPLGVFGDTGLYGNVLVGPEQNIAQTPVLLTVTGDAKISDSTIIGSTLNPSFNLHLVGDTNIGLGNECTLTPQNINTGCPIGTYLYQYDSNNPTIIGKCREFNPSQNPTNIGTCYGQVGLSTNIIISSSNDPTPSGCGVVTYSLSSVTSGGISPYTYSWYKVSDVEPFSEPTNWGSVIGSGSSISNQVINEYLNGEDEIRVWFKVVVTDQNNNSSSDILSIDAQPQC